MDAEAAISQVTIVGGGTAGWMAAALLGKLLTGYKIRLIESDEIGTIGVGEATIPAIKIFNQMVGLDDRDLLQSAQATFKMGIEFVNWRASGQTYLHGFGSIGQDLLWLHTHQFWLRAQAEGTAKHFDTYALNCVAARMNKFGLPDKRNPNSPLADIDYAYHFDAGLYARKLRELAEHSGVERIEGRIVGTHRDAETGHLTEVVLADGRTVPGQLFIDCSGMRGLLIGDEMGSAYHDWSQWLLCDRALAVPCENAPVLTPYTRSTAHGAGWQWRIPLQHRIGNGMVYSSAHQDDDTAARILLSNLDGQPLKDPMPVRFRPGRRDRSWVGNVVAIGLSSGFLEPLESTSIHLIQTGLFRLIALFPGRGFDPRIIEEFNRQTAFEYEDVRDFIIAHYKVTERDDTEFWRYLKDMPVPDSLQRRLDLFAASGRFFQYAKAELFREESWAQVLIGQGFPMAPDPTVEIIPREQASEFLKDIEEVIADTAERMEDHAAFIARVLNPPAPAPTLSIRRAQTGGSASPILRH